jgi:hypothetical protein
MEELDMKASWIFLARLLVAVLPIAGAASMLGATGTKNVASGEAATEAGEVLVKFTGMQPRMFGMIAPGTRNQKFALLAALPNEALKPLQDIEGSVVRVSSETGVALVKLGSGISVDQAIAILRASEAVEYAEPNYRIHVIKDTLSLGRSAGAQSSGTATPNDPGFGLQWGLNNTGQTVGGTAGSAGADIEALLAWGKRTDASTTVVAVMGTGIDYTHPDLKANIWKNPGETCGDAKDNDSDGYVDDCYGINAYLNTGDPKDDNGVGTHMAGIVGATGNNGIGVAGVAWKAKLMALKFLDEEGWGTAADAVQSIDYALYMQNKYSYRMVILAPVMGASYSKALYDSINTAMGKGVLFVTGAGDGNQNVDQWPFYPGGYDLANILSVTPSESSDYTMGMSVAANSVDVEAPGRNIYSTWITNTYKLQTGSNSAASFVAGAAALVWSQYPTYNWKQIKALILNGAEDGLHPNYWYGNSMTEARLNLNNSLTATLASQPAIFSVTPQVTNVNEIVTINGWNFGTTKATVAIAGGSYVFPSSSISSWANDKIVVKIPATSPSGQLRLLVKNANGTSRGAVVRFRSATADQWIYPTWMGATLMQHEEAAYAQVGNDMWIISGRDNYEQTASVERYSLLTMKGQVNPDWDIPLAVRRAGAAAIGTKIYVAGGFDDVTQKWQSALQIFDTATGSWMRGRNLPAPLDEPSVTTFGGKIYVIGGRSPNNTGLKTTYVFDPTANSWSVKASLPLKTAFATAVIPPTALAGANKIWLLSGYNESGGSFTQNQNVLEYDTGTNTWTIRDEIPLLGPHPAGGGIVLGNKVFCAYGNGDWTAGEWISTYSTRWVRHIALQGGMGSYTPMMGKVGNYIYLISGSRARNVYRIYLP